MDAANINEGAVYDFHFRNDEGEIAGLLHGVVQSVDPETERVTLKSTTGPVVLVVDADDVTDESGAGWFALVEQAEQERTEAVVNHPVLGPELVEWEAAVQAANEEAAMEVTENDEKEND